MAWHPKGLRIYRVLLKAYPEEFRGEFGQEMEQLFADRLATEPHWRVWLDAIFDVATTAPREHAAILTADLHHGLRVIAKSPASSAVILLTMALGIGVTTAVFSLVHAVLLRSFPYGDVSHLAYVWTPNSHIEGLPHEFGPSAADYFEFKKNTRTFQDMSIFSETGFRLEDASGVSRVSGVRVSGNFFSLLQVYPAIGRPIDANDDQAGHERVVVISDVLWKSRFNGRSDVLGQILRIDRQEYTVIGVMPPNFAYPHGSDFPPAVLEIDHADLWIPYALTDKQKVARTGDDWVNANVLGRLHPGTTVAQAQAEMSALEQRLDPLYPESFRGWGAYVQSFGDAAAGSVRLLVWLLFGAVSLVLLIACANVAGLLTARAAGRVHEMGVRSALGAGRTRLMRQMLTEAVLLSCGGGILGVLIAFAAMHGLIRFNPGDIPRLEEISLNPIVLVFAVAVSLLTGFVFGLAPAWTASRVNLTDLLKQGGNKGATPGAAKRLRNILIVSEVAMAMVLLAGAGLLIRSYVTLQRVDKGFSTATLTTHIALDDKYQTPQQQRDFYTRLLQQVRAIPGVENVGLISGIPLGHHESLSLLEVEGYPNKQGQMSDIRTVMGEYLESMSIRLVAGRYLNPDDGPRPQKVCVVSQSFADTYFPGREAIGRRLRTSGEPNAPWITIVGIVADVRHSNLEDRPRPVFYLQWTDGSSDRNLDLAIRTTSPVTQVNAALQGVVKRLDSELTVPPVKSMKELVSQAGALRRFQTVLLSVFAGIAILLPLVGLYGLMAYSVKQRTGEIGIRMTLGASRRRVVGMVVQQGVTLVSAGLLLGLAGALALTRVAASLLYGISARDPLTFVVAPLFLLLVAIAACMIPAWKASKISPVEALRYE